MNKLCYRCCLVWISFPHTDKYQSNYKTASWNNGEGNPQRSKFQRVHVILRTGNFQMSLKLRSFWFSQHLLSAFLLQVIQNILFPFHHMSHWCRHAQYQLKAIKKIKFQRKNIPRKEVCKAFFDHWTKSWVVFKVSSASDAAFKCSQFEQAWFDILVFFFLLCQLMIVRWLDIVNGDKAQQTFLESLHNQEFP